MHLARKELLEWLVGIEMCNIYGGSVLRKEKNQKTCQNIKIQMKKILSGLMKPFGTD